MGTSNQQRRAAKRRARASALGQDVPPKPGTGRRAQADDPPSGYPDPFGHPEPQPPLVEQALRRLLSRGALTAAAGVEHALDRAVQDLIVFAGTAATDDVDLPGRVATEMLIDQVASAYEHGWQPTDLVHVAQRELGARPGRVASAVVLAQSERTDARSRAPEAWIVQLDLLVEGSPQGREASHWVVTDAFDGRQVSAWDLWHQVLSLLGHWMGIAELPRLIAPPSAWTARRAAVRASTPPAGHDPRMLTRIRALLAKAEGTEYPEEADAFTTKAQDLMTRYAIDEALLSDVEGDLDIRSRRVPIDNPYASTKVQLLAAVGVVNRVRAIWDDHHGIATIVGLPVDLDLAEMLFTSLLVQATRAMTDAGQTTDSGHRTNRAPSFRRAFLHAYADRIGERLAEAGAHAVEEEAEHRGGGLLPVLARRSAAVENEFVRLFPQTRKMGARRVDARGWHAGRAAADRAVFTRGQVRGSG